MINPNPRRLNMKILAIDLGKFHSMCCFFDTKTQQHSFWNAATTRAYLTTVLKTHQVDLVVMEACGPSGWVSDLCQEHGLKTLVCSTNEEAWRWHNVKRKTDKDDALKLARLTMMRQLIRTRRRTQHDVVNTNATSGFLKHELLSDWRKQPNEQARQAEDLSLRPPNQT